MTGSELIMVNMVLKSVAEGVVRAMLLEVL